MAASARQRIVFGLLVTVLGAAAFAFASAYVVDRGLGKVAAAIVGAFAFPVAPAVWHLIAERRRRARLAAAKKPPSATLTGFDRYWLRFAVVALLVLGPMFAVSRLGVLGAVWRHGLWFWPEPSADLSRLGNGPARDFKAEEHLLVRVPSDAELVFVFHQKPEDGKPGGSGVVAWGAGQAMIAVDASLDDGESHAKKLDDINENRGKIPFLQVAAFSEVATSDSTVVFATDGWKSKVEAAASGPSEELRGELARAPQDAMVVIGFTPRSKLTAHDVDAETIRHGVVWAMLDDKALALAGRMELKDAAAASKLHDELQKLLHVDGKDVPEGCRDQVAKIAAGAQLQQQGTILTARAELPTEALMGLMFCAIK